jgi:hypothetical protein
MSKKDKKRIKELAQDSRILSGKIRNLQHNFELLFKDVKQEQARADIAVSQRFEALNMHFGIFKAGTIPSQTAKDSPTRDGAKLDNSEEVCFVRLGRNWGKSGLGMLKSMFEGQDKCEPKQDRTEHEKPAQTEPITPEKEQAILAKLNAELAKFASLEVFNADRKNFFLPPVGKLEFDKMKAAIECTIAIAKMVRPDYFDQISQIKVPVSEQPEAEPKQGSDGADSPKKSDTDQPEIHQPDRTKATLSKMVLGRIEEMEKLLANPNLGVVELSFFIHDRANELQLDLADFRRKVLDLGKSEQQKPEFSEQVSPNIDYYVTRKDGRIMEQKKDGYYTWWVHGTYMPYTSFSSPKQAIDAIEKYIKFAYYRADKDTTIPVLNDFGITQISRMKPSELAQPNPEKDSKKQGEADQTEAEKNQVWIVQTNPKKAERLNAFYIDFVGEDGIIRHTPNPDEAMNFIERSTAQIVIDNIIKNGKGRYIAADFKLRQIGAKQSEIAQSKAANYAKKGVNYAYIIIANHGQGGLPLYLLDFEKTECDGVPDMTIETTSQKHNAREFEYIKHAQNFIDLAIELGANKDYNFFIDTLEKP